MHGMHQGESASGGVATYDPVDCSRPDAAARVRDQRGDPCPGDPFLRTNRAPSPALQPVESNGGSRPHRPAGIASESPDGAFGQPFLRAEALQGVLPHQADTAESIPDPESLGPIDESGNVAGRERHAPHAVDRLEAHSVEAEESTRGAQPEKAIVRLRDRIDVCRRAFTSSPRGVVKLCEREAALGATPGGERAQKKTGQEERTTGMQRSTPTKRERRLQMYIPVRSTPAPRAAPATHARISASAVADDSASSATFLSVCIRSSAFRHAILRLERSRRQPVTLLEPSTQVRLVGESALVGHPRCGLPLRQKSTSPGQTCVRVIAGWRESHRFRERARQARERDTCDRPELRQAHGFRCAILEMRADLLDRAW